MRITTALPVFAAALALAGVLRADEEPSLFPETPAPSPSPAPAQPGTPAAPPATLVTLPKPAAPGAPLRKTLDFARWQEMSFRERQTYVEGMVQAQGALTTRVRLEIGGDGRMSPEAQAAVVKFVDANFPKRPTAVYLKEMESIYLTAEGQKLSMLDCFQQAFRRSNGG